MVLALTMGVCRINPARCLLNTTHSVTNLDDLLGGCNQRELEGFFMLDVTIIGAGPAGLSAALLLGRSRRSVLICDDGRPRNARARAMHGFLTRDGIAPLEFLHIAREQLRTYPTVDYRPIEVVTVHREEHAFGVTLADHAYVRSRKLLLCTGIADELPPLPGVQDFFGTSVFQCPYCHGWEVRDQPLACYGQGKSGMGKALQLLQWSPDITLCTNGMGQLEAHERGILTAHHIPVYEERITQLKGTNGQLEQIVFADGKRLAVRALFCFTETHQQNDFPQRLGYTMTNPFEDAHPTVPGLYMAGDAFHSHRVTDAVAEGAEVAIIIQSTLFREDLTRGDTIRNHQERDKQV
jgi:thioredoxin reductase